MGGTLAARAQGMVAVHKRGEDLKGPDPEIDMSFERSISRRVPPFSHYIHRWLGPGVYPIVAIGRLLLLAQGTHV